MIAGFVRRIFAKEVAGLAAVVAVSLVLMGCDSQRQVIADLVSPPTAAEMASRIELAVEQNHATAAIERGEAFLGKHADPEGEVHRALAVAYLSTGNAVAAARHMQASIADAASVTLAAPAPAASAESSSAVTALPAAPAAPAVPAAPAAPAAVTVQAGDAAVSIAK